MTRPFTSRENSVALASEETANTFYVPSTMGIGNSFAGNVRLNSATGLNVQGRLSVGHESVDSTGATAYVKDALLVGDTAHSLMPSDFKGVLVEGGLGIGTSSLMGAISLQGGFKLKDKMSFYNDETRKFEIKPRKISVVPSSYGLNFQVSKSMNYSVSLLDKKVLSVVPGVLFLVKTMSLVIIIYFFKTPMVTQNFYWIVLNLNLVLNLQITRVRGINHWRRACQVQHSW